MKKQDPGLVLTGVDELDQVIKVLLSTNMFVAGFLGFFLDNTLPGYNLIPKGWPKKKPGVFKNHLFTKNITVNIYIE